MLWYACCLTVHCVCGRVAVGRVPLPGALEGVDVMRLNSSSIGGTRPRDTYPGTSFFSEARGLGDGYKSIHRRHAAS